MHDLDEDLNFRNLWHSSYAAQARADLRRPYAQRWRDRRSEGERKIEDAHDEEWVLHDWWRKLPWVRRPWPEDPYAQQIEQLTRGWEEFLGTHPMLQLSTIRQS